MEKVIELINKEQLSNTERLELLNELYWADWIHLSTNNPEVIKRILSFLRNNDFNEEEISLIQKLYSNPDGAYIEELSHIITKLYIEDKVKFIKALHLNIEEAESLSYMFRNNKVFSDGDIELEEILATNKLNEDEKDSANTFFRMYKNVCNT